MFIDVNRDIDNNKFLVWGVGIYEWLVISR